MMDHYDRGRLVDRSERDRRIVPPELVLAFLWLAVLAGCGRMMSAATGDMADHLSQAIANHDDPVTVRDGGPAYLLMLDAMIGADPENVDLVVRAATLYSTYGTAFVDDPLRAGKLTRRALDYAERALCLNDPQDCHLREAEFEVFQNRLQRLQPGEIPLFYTLGAAWAGWIQVHREDLSAVADLARVEAIMRRVVAVDESHRDGGAHLYLGTFAILLPPALGGRPEDARRHFDRALAISGGKNLMAKVVYARQYARMVYDRDLHDRLLTEVLAEDPYVPGRVLENVMAQERARELLAGADDYF